MIIPPNIFGQVKGQAFTPYPSFGHQMSFKVTPEAFEAVNMGSFSIAVFSLSMLNQPMNVPPGRDAGVTPPSIRADDGTPPNPSSNKGKQCFGLHIGNNVGPNLPASTQDSKDRGFGRPSTSFGSFAALGEPLILPRSTQIRFVHFHRSTEDRWDLVRHRLSYTRQCPQHTLGMQSRFFGNRRATGFSDKPSQQLPPLPGAQAQW